MKLQVLLLILLIFPLRVLLSSENSPEVGIVEKLGNQLPMNSKFIDENGQEVVLNQLLTKPTIIAFVYFHCPGICSPLQTGLAEAIDKLKLEPGKDYQVLSISFDHEEGPDKAIKWQKEYISSLKRKFEPNNWKFLTSDSITIRKLTDASGFYFKPDGKDDFIHSASLIVLTPEGKISRYLFGTQFNPFDMKLALIEAQKGKFNPTINKVLEFCYSYDPENKKYVFNVTKVAGSIIFLAIGVFFTILLVKGRRNKIKTEINK